MRRGPKFWATLVAVALVAVLTAEDQTVVAMVLGASATEAGALLTPGIVVSPLCAFVSGQILSRTGHARRTCRAGAVLQLVGLAMLLYVPPTIAELWVRRLRDGQVGFKTPWWSRLPPVW